MASLMVPIALALGTIYSAEIKVAATAAVVGTLPAVTAVTNAIVRMCCGARQKPTKKVPSLAATFRAPAELPAGPTATTPELDAAEALLGLHYSAGHYANYIEPTDAETLQEATSDDTAAN